MTTDIQDTLFELFEQVRRDPDTLPPVPLDRWQEESVERRLLTSFQGMLEHFQQRTFQFKQAEQALREREEQYRAIFEATIDGLSINDLEDGRVIEANPALCRMFGYTYEEFIDLPPTATIHPDTYHVVADVLQRVQAGSQFQTRFVALRKDGTAFHAEGRGTPFIYKGKPHLLGATRDITEQVQAEEQLREKEAQYRAIFEATSDGLSIAGLEDGHVVEINPAACKMYGYAYEEMIGLPPTATIHPDSFHHVTEALHAIQAVGQYQARLVAMRKDGTTFHIDGRGTPFMYNGKTHILAVMRDITEQVEAEEHLREKEAQYRGIFEATYDGINILDLDGFFVEVNPAFCSMFGYTREELIGLHASALAAPVDQHILTESLETLKAGRDFQTAVARGLRKDGTIFYVESHSTTLTYGGKPHLLGVSRDITKRVEAEQRLREQEEQYRGIFEATYDGLAIADLENGCYVEANPAYCVLFGYTHDELIGLHTSVLFPPERHSYLARDLETLNAGRDTQTLTQGLRKDGTVFSLEAHGTLFTYRGKPHALGVVRDITKRVEAEQQLREREEQYRSIFEATSDALLIGDLADGHVVEVNPAACQMYGYSYKEFIGLAPDVITPPDYQHLLKEARQRIQAGDQLQTQSVALRKDGTIFSVETHAGPFIYRGRPHMLAIVRDITERVEAEQHLREKEAQYRSVFEATDDGLVIQDLDGFFVEVNPAFCSMLGYTHEELIDLHYSQVTHPEYYPVVEENIQKIQAEGRAQAQGFARRKDGSSLPVEAHSTSFTYKGKPHVLGVMRDITERVEAEKQLREREEQYRSVFEATSDALCIVDLEGFLVEVNPAFCRLFGYTYEEIIGLHTRILTPLGYLPLLAQALETLKAEGRFEQFETRGQYVRKDGSLFFVEVLNSPFTYRGKPHSLRAIHDITEQVQAQQLLEQRVEERTRELSSLLEISHTVASTLQLKPLLGLILDQLKTVVDYTGSSILTVEGEELVFLDSRSPTPEEQLLQLRFPLKNLRLIWKRITSRESIIIQDVRDDTPLARAFRVAMGELGETTFHYVRACMLVPLMLRDRVIGMLALTSSEEQAFTQHHAMLALAIANQAAVAIENARLYAQAKELAAVEERQRLARELHDSVSQALYGISLGTHTARTQLDRDPSKAAAPLDYVLSLAEAALAEMRALIFELRPESLETEGLVSALTKQSAALHARHNIAVQTDLCEEPALSLTVKQELYRIAQEALHNTVKHAQATRVDLRLEQVSEAVVLEVGDNGRGFDATASFPGHLGLHSMRERITNLGGTFQIESAPGQGTRIRARVPVHAR